MIFSVEQRDLSIGPLREARSVRDHYIVLPLVVQLVQQVMNDVHS